MAVTAVKTWVAGEILTASDLNGEFANIYDNGQDLAWPATKEKDFDGQKLILDADGDTSLTSDTDDQLDWEIGGTDLIKWTAGVYEYTSVDAGSAIGPLLKIYRNSASAADADFIGGLYFDGNDDAGTPAQVTYASIEAQIDDSGAGSEDATFLLKTMVAGTLTTQIDISSGAVAVTPPLNASGGGALTGTFTGVTQSASDNSTKLATTAYVDATGGGNVSNTGTPVDGQLAVWTDATTIEGTSDFTFDGADLTIYNAVNDGNPEIRLGAADAEELHVQVVYESGTQLLEYVLFTTDVASGTADRGLYRFNVDGTDILDIDDGGLVLTGSVVLSGTVDGRDVAADGAVIDGLGTSSTVDTGVTSGLVPLVGTKSATLALAGLVEQSTSAENIAGTDDTVFPSVAGAKEMIDTHASGGDAIFSNQYSGGF